MIGARQRIGHMTVVGHPTNLDVWSVTIHCGCWSNNNTKCMCIYTTLLHYCVATGWTHHPDIPLSDTIFS